MYLSEKYHKVHWFFQDIFHAFEQGLKDALFGSPFSPTLVVEVADVGNSDSPNFKELDSKFKDSYFAANMSVTLGWLIDPINDEIWFYKNSSKTKNVYRRQRLGWWRYFARLYTLRVWKIKDVMSKLPSRPPE
ncbi:16731_t:CDS:2 [Funneliformis geosporum]|nr:16731_t:CDS:2 [Funneliformis geosporum]